MLATIAGSAAYNCGVSRRLSDASLLEHIRKLPHARATYKQLVRELHLQGENRDLLEEALDRLAGNGLLVELRSGHFIAVGANSEYVAGRLSVHRDGFGFLIPDQAIQDVSGDIFLPPAEAAKGMHGDRALVHVTHAAVKAGRRARSSHSPPRASHRGRRIPHPQARQLRRAARTIASSSGSRFPKAWNCRRAAPRLQPRGCCTRREISSVEDLDGMIVNAEILEFPEEGEPGRRAA